MKKTAAFAFALVTVGACGGSSSSVELVPPYTLDDVCERTAPKVCELRKPCCEKTHGYDEQACLAEAKATCAKDVADARAGRATFRQERIDPCLAKYKPLFEGCYETFSLVTEAAATLKDCQAFEGQLAEGEACERGSQCKPSPDANAVTGCDDKTKRCTTTKLLGEGAACRIGDGASGFCTAGLYCDADFTKAPVVGTCKRATARGAICDTTKQFALECGLGSYCDKTSGKCTAAKAAGAPCNDNLECERLECDANKTCAPLKPLVDLNECKAS